MFSIPTLHDSNIVHCNSLQLDKMYVIKVGELKLTQDGQTVLDPNFIHEAGGFSYFGEQALKQPFKCPYTITCASETAQMLSLPKRQLDNFLGQDTGLDSDDAIIAALKKCQALQVCGWCGDDDIFLLRSLGPGIYVNHSLAIARPQRVQEAEWKQLLPEFEQSSYNVGDVIVAASNGPSNKVYLVKTGEVALVAADAALPGTALPGNPYTLTSHLRHRILLRYFSSVNLLVQISLPQVKSTWVV